MKRWLRSLWRWSWIATLPCSALFLLWVMTTWQHWRKFSIDYDARPWRATLYETGIDRWEHMLRQASIGLRASDLNDVPEGQQLPSIQLFAGESELAKLGENLPYSGFEFVDALLTYPDGLHKVKMRYRGDFVVHWGYDKKSIRIRTKTDDLFAGMRQFNLIAPKFPEQINNTLAYRLASLLGLIAPRCELVNVFLNGSNQGVHEFTEQLDEGTLRRHDRMPGDIYSGDLVSKDLYRGTSNQVFELPQAWEKIAENNHYDLQSRAPLERLLRLLNGSPDEETQAELSQLLDMETWGRFGAFELLTQTEHFDEAHNWRLFWDPWRLEFEPMIWDPTGWTPQSRAMDATAMAMDIASTRLHQWLLQNGDYLAARHRALQHFYADGVMEQFLAERDRMLNCLGPALRLDPGLRPNETTVAFWLSIFSPYVDQILREVRSVHLDDAGTVSWARVDAGTLRLQVDGRRPTSELLLQFEHPLARPDSIKLRTRHFGVPHDVDLSSAVSLQDSTLRVPARLFCELVPTLRFVPQHLFRHNSRAPAPATYDLCLQGVPADNRLLTVTAVRAGKPEIASAVADLPERDVEFLYRATPPPRRASPLVWRGEVLVEGVQDVKDDVSIEPGTVVRLGPGACVLFRGRVTAIGTREQPIRFEPHGPDQKPWGTVALNGPNCSGSALQWCNVRGGSGYKVPLEEYCSMFSIHNCERVSVADCSFAENSNYDDMIHVVYASVVFDRVTLADAVADGLDCDISTVVVRNSAFLRSHNDGIDLMTTRALVQDCRFENNGDKGISIGEGTHLIALRNRFAGCNLAMEAKDGSIAHVANCDIRRCKKAMNAYRKNWRYAAGGFLTVHKSVVVDNEALPTADKWSRLELIDCQVAGELAAEYDQPNLDGTTTHMRNTARLVSSDAGASPRHRDPLPFPEDLRPFEHLFGETWGSVRPETRGVPDGR